MVSGDWCPGSSTCTALPASLSASGNPYLLTFNEPDNPSQSNMTVARALQLWPYLEATGLQLGSPAVTDSSRGIGVAGRLHGRSQHRTGTGSTSSPSTGTATARVPRA